MTRRDRQEHWRNGPKVWYGHTTAQQGFWAVQWLVAIRRHMELVENGIEGYYDIL